MSRNILLTVLLMLAAPSSPVARPTVRTEAIAPTDASPRVVPPADTKPVPTQAAAVPVIEGAGGPHEGHHAAPHHGALVPIGVSDRHLELVLKPESGTLTLYVLDADAAKPAAIQQDMVYLKIQAGDGEFPIVLFGDREAEGSGRRPRGMAKFAAGHRRLRGVTRFHAEISGVQVGRQSFRRIRFAYPDGTEP